MKNKAFTLIELLVVIAIIGILSGLIVVSMNGSINSANDAKRKANIDAIRKALIVYGTLNGGVYPTGIPEAAGCNISSNGATTNRCTNLAPALSELLPNLPNDPISGNYYTYISNGTIFTVSSVLSSEKTYGYSSSTGSYNSMFARVSAYTSIMPINYVTTVADSGSLFGLVANYTSGWAGYTYLSRSNGFNVGVYDVYIRVRNNGAGNNPNMFYGGVWATIPYTTLTSWNVPITTSYQVIKTGRFTITEANLSNNIYTFFSSSGIDTNYYIDYIEFRPVQ
jgi:prepilin-type N-terminal cleavage/methylation domain-containing protein